MGPPAESTDFIWASSPSFLSNVPGVNKEPNRKGEDIRYIQMINNRRKYGKKIEREGVKVKNGRQLAHAVKDCAGQIKSTVLLSYKLLCL